MLKSGPAPRGSAPSRPSHLRGGERGGGELRLLPRRKHDLARAHGAVHEARERAQRKRDAREARPVGGAAAAQPQALRVRQPRRERLRRRFRPLTAQVSVI